MPPEDLGKERIGAFSDGVFAIAITLLVLDIRVPEGLAPEKLRHALLHEVGARVLAYALSFMIVGVYWVAHHLMLSAMRRTDRTLLWINNLFLMCVAFVPASAALLGGYPRQSEAITVYGVNLICVCLAMLLLWRYATREHHLVYEDIRPEFVRGGYRRPSVAIVIYCVAIVLAHVNTLYSLVVYWLAPLSYIFLQAGVVQSPRTLPRA